MMPWIGGSGELQGKLERVCADGYACKWKTHILSHGSGRRETLPGRPGIGDKALVSPYVGVGVGE